MNTSDIRGYLRTDPVLRRHKIHVITSDMPVTGDACVVNTLRSHESGVGHWYVVANINGKTELFDSLALMGAKVSHDIANVRAVQHQQSAACGHHCCLYLSLRYRGLNLSQIIKQYSSDLVLNDKLSYSFVSLVQNANK